MVVVTWGWVRGRGWLAGGSAVEPAGCGRASLPLRAYRRPLGLDGRGDEVVAQVERVVPVVRDPRPVPGTTDQPRQYRFRTDPLDPGRHVFRLRQVDLDGTATRSDTVAVQVRLAEAGEMAVAPNPVHTRATVSLRVRAEQEVRVALYDVLGRRVRTVHDGSMTPGRAHTLRVNAGQLSSGMYFLRADGEQFQTTRRVTVVR